MSEKNPHRYDKIINLEHFVSRNRKHMSNYDRAAQFAPFDALTGYDEAIEETGRTTENEIFLGDNEIEELDIRFRIIEDCIKDKPTVKIRYFIPDLYKDGGMYKDETISIRAIDLVKRIIVSTDKKKYDMDYIIAIDGEIFDEIGL